MKKKPIIIGAVAVAVVIAAAVAFTAFKKGPQKEENTVSVERRSIESIVSGKSVIEPKDSYSVTAAVSGEIVASGFEEGDMVQKGDVLYEIDSETAQNSIESAKLAIDKAQISYRNAIDTKDTTQQTNQTTLESAKLAVEKAQRTYNDAVSTQNKMDVKSGITGIVGTVYVEKGDTVNTGGKIADVYNSKYMKVRIPFNEEDAANIRVNDSGNLTVAGTGNEIYATVSRIDDAVSITDSHARVRYVTLEAQNPGGLTTNDKATAVINGVACNDAGQFEYIEEKTLSSSGSGEIVSLNIKEGDMVYNGTVVASLDKESTTTQVDNALSSIADAQNSLEKARLSSDTSSQEAQVQTALLSLKDAKLSLEKAQETLEDYTITAPISGKVIKKNSKVGDKTGSSGASSASTISSTSSASSSSASSGVMAIIYDLSGLKFEMSVDEIDVAKIHEGQEVSIQVDAVTDKIYTGTVSRVGINGTSENGVTTYPVTVEFNEMDNLLPGMNIDAEIVVEKAENILAIPTDCLNRGNTVYVKGDKENNDDKAPEGYKTVKVEIGINDDSYIEIKQGLKEGDVIKSQAQQNNTNSMYGMDGGMGGGPGTGGGPSGGGAPGGGGGGAPAGGPGGR